MYKSRPITNEEAYKIRANIGWNEVCENRYGIAFWNSNTGELLWIAQEGDSTVSEKINK
jgi:hypothetical protein